MSEEQSSSKLAGIHPGPLFLGSCFALIATSVNFAVIADVMGALKSEFILTNEQVGNIAGAATWGFTISIFVLGPFCDILGMRRLLGFAFMCHLFGALAMIFAKSFDNGYLVLYTGALMMSLANGTVEAVCNPLIATIYPDQKTKKLNQFHVWFPGGIVIGGLLCFVIAKTQMNYWQLKICLIIIPTIIYGVLFFSQKFPATERAQSGVSFGEMTKATLLRPLFIILFFCMMITASLELGPSRWIPSILESGGMPGILVLVWVTGLMAVMRSFAGAVVKRIPPTTLLLLSAIIAGLGLVALSYAESLALALVAATIFAVGVCYFWPTMLGVVSERVPKGGEMALGLMGGIGMAAVGLITTPWMGAVADEYLAQQLKPAETTQVLEEGVAALNQLADEAAEAVKSDFVNASESVSAVVTAIEANNGELPHPDTANALRTIVDNAAGTEAGKNAEAILNPADNYGGRMSFRYVAPFSLIIILVFGAIAIMDKAKGGYKAEKIVADTPEDAA